MTKNKTLFLYSDEESTDILLKCNDVIPFIKKIPLYEYNYLKYACFYLHLFT